MKIKNRHNKVLHESESSSLKEALSKAILEGVKLRGVDLRGADLRGTYFKNVDLERAYLRGADLEGANLEGANLRWADLRDANLDGANLKGADLRWVYLDGANLRWAYIEGADLEVPTIEDIHKKVYDACNKEGALDMSYWHTCETTHCRAGWVVNLAGEAGRVLENKIGTPSAAYLIYRKSDPTEYPLDFYTSNEEALEDMRKLAKQ